MIEQVMSLGAPDVLNVGRRTLAEILRDAERRTMKGIYWIVRTVTLAESEPGVVEVILWAMEHRSSPLSWIASHPFYSAGSAKLLHAFVSGAQLGMRSQSRVPLCLRVEALGNIF